ncbi:MAG: RCC1 domain-containing protein [Kofleriaceae bacterium]
MRWTLVAISLAGCGRWDFDELPTGDAGLPPRVVELSHRGTAVCVRSSDGRVACWGGNDQGQLGRGSGAATGAPELLALSNIVRIATAENAAFAIDADGALWGWGGNQFGQLGLGRTSPTEQTPQLVTIAPVVDVASGENHTCAITRQGGELYCWGNNQCGQLGTGDTMQSWTPRQVPGVSGARDITVHDQQTCFIDSTGMAQCFGAPYVANDTCQGLRLTPTPPVGLGPVVDIAGGCHLSMCAADSSGDAWCWGDDVAGVLGNGPVMETVDPSPVETVTNIKKIRTGYIASCAVNQTNDVFCWGANTEGELGIGNMSIGQANAPLQLPFFNGVVVDQIETGCTSTCVRSGSDIYCWGENEWAVIDDTTVNAFSPRKILGLPF